MVRKHNQPQTKAGYITFLPSLTLISVFCLTNGTARILPQFLSFTSPVTSIDAGAHDNKLCERESACGVVPERIGALKIFGRIRVQTSRPQSMKRLQLKRLYLKQR